MPGGTRNIKMSTDMKAEVSEHNQIPIDKDKLKEEQKAELQAVVEAFERQCLLSYITNRSGEVIKKYNFPNLPPYNESQKEDWMIHQMNQAIGHAFVNHAPIMTMSTMLCSRRCKIGEHLALWDRPINRLIRWSFLLLDRLLGYHRLTLKLRQMGMS